MQSDHAETSTLPPFAFIFSDKAALRIFYLWWSTPFIFIILRHLLPFPATFATQSISPLEIVWPVLSPQIAEIERSGAPAGHYALFIIVSLLFVAALIGAAGWRFVRQPERLAPPGGYDLFIIVICFFGTIYGLFFDEVNPQSHLYFDFFVDGLGLYYIRQFPVIFTMGLGMLMLVTSTVAILYWLCRRITEKFTD